MALAESRTPTTELRGSTPGDALDLRYRDSYPAALARAGVDGLDLVDRFPVLNAMYGYTRGDDDPSKSSLVPFRRKRGGHLLSKGRLLAAQLEGYFANDHWLANARHANQ